MQEENKHLTPEQARHLTQYGVNQNEDGTYSWKFDHYVRLWPPYDMTRDAIAELWGAIDLPDPAGLRHRKLGEEPGRGWPAGILQQRPRSGRGESRALGSP